MAYTDSFGLLIRLRGGDFVGSGELIREHRESFDEIGEVSLDRLHEALNAFVSEVYIEDKLARGFTINDAPVAVQHRVEATVHSQGGDGSSVVLILDLLSDKAWDLWVGLFGAWLYDWMKGQRNDDR